MNEKQRARLWEAIGEYVECVVETARIVDMKPDLQTRIAMGFGEGNVWQRDLIEQVVSEIVDENRGVTPKGSRQELLS